MLLLCIDRGKGKGSVVSKFEDDALDTAVALAEDIVSHQRARCSVILQKDDKKYVLKRIYRNWRNKLVVR